MTKLFITGSLKQNAVRLMVIILLHAAVTIPLQAQPPAFAVTGKIKIEKPFTRQSSFFKWYYDSLFYEKARSTTNFECLKLQYKSDTAMVEAWLYKPVETGNRKWPLVIYNRGGNGNYGNLEETNLVDFYKMAENGYIVLATKTRFAGANGKYDQHGGIDVNDIVNLQQVYTRLLYVDTANIFMYGFSRGGQNTYQASLRMKLNAMTVTAGTADWLSFSTERTEFATGWTDEDTTMNYIGFRKAIPGWGQDSIGEMKHRSAVYWAGQINTPVLILHSRLDTRVPCMHALKLAAKLQEYKKEYALVIYDEPSHSLPFSQFDSYDRMFRWFDKHKKKPNHN